VTEKTEATCSASQDPHDGRIRSFEHVEGHYPTHVFLRGEIAHPECVSIPDTAVLSVLDALIGGVRVWSAPLIVHLCGDSILRSPFSVLSAPPLAFGLEKRRETPSLVLSLALWVREEKPQILH
jgi:hypothetical protein